MNRSCVAVRGKPSSTRGVSSPSSLFHGDRPRQRWTLTRTRCSMSSMSAQSVRALRNLLNHGRLALGIWSERPKTKTIRVLTNHWKSTKCFMCSLVVVRVAVPGYSRQRSRYSQDMATGSGRVSAKMLLRPVSLRARRQPDGVALTKDSRVKSPQP